MQSSAPVLGVQVIHYSVGGTGAGIAVFNDSSLRKINDFAQTTISRIIFGTFQIQSKLQSTAPNSFATARQSASRTVLDFLKIR